MTTINNTVIGDNVYGTIASSLSVIATSLTFTSGHGARFPEIVAPNVMYCVILNSGNVLEEIKITAHTSGSDSATISRGVGGTTAKAWSAGDRIEARLSSSVLESISSELLTAGAYGATGDGVTDDTAAMLAFFNACINGEATGYIEAGTYLITKGQLAFDNGFTDKVWPNIFTAGHKAVIFKSSAATNAAFIAITNGTADSAVGKYWRGGALGGITFQDSSGAVAANAHGLKLQGLQGVRFGYMKGESLRGDLIHVEANLFGGTNPDPYAVFLCHFECIDAASCVGWALNNDNYVGFNVNVIDFLRVTEGGSGGWRGFGDCNKLNAYSMGSVSGWAFDDRTTSTGGNSNRVSLGLGELDNVENGFRLNTTKRSDLGLCRIVHRYQTSPNADPDYWPREALSISPSGGVVDGITLTLDNRLDAGGAEVTLGEYINYNNAAGNALGIEVNINIDDQAGFGIPITDLYTGLNTNTCTKLWRNGQVVLDTMQSPKAIARVTSAQDVPTSAGIVVWNSTEFDNYSAYNNATGEYTVPVLGYYEVVAQVSVSGASAGERIILTIELDGSAVATKYDYATGTGVQGYTVARKILCVLGAVLRVKSVTNGASPRAMQTGSDFTFINFTKMDGR